MLRLWLSRLRSRTFIRAIKWLAFSLLTFLFIAFITTGFIVSSESGRLWLTQTAIAKLNHSTHFNIELIGVSSPSLARMQSDSIQIKKYDQRWLTINKLDIAWQPSALLNKEIIVDNISGESLTVHSTTPIDATQDQNTDSGLINSLPDIQIKNLAVKKLQINLPANHKYETQSLIYAVTAKVNKLTHAPFLLDIQAESLNTTAASLHVRATSRDWIHTKLTGTFQEHAGGIIGGYLRAPKTLPINAKFDIAITQHTEDYQVNINTLQWPLAQHALTAEGELSVPNTFDGFSLKHLLLTVDDTEHMVSGRLINDNVNFSVNLKQLPLDISNIWQPNITGGAISAALTITGTTTAPEAQGNITFNTNYKNLAVAADFTGKFSQQSLIADALTASINDSTIKLHGEIFRFSEKSNFTVSAQNFDLSILPIFNITTPENTSGTITSLHAKLHGPIKDLNGQLTFLAEGKYSDQRLGISADIEKKNTNLIVKNMAVNIDEGTLVAKGHLDTKTHQGLIELSSKSMDVNIIALAGLSIPESLTGSFSSQLVLSDNLQKPHIEGQLSLSGSYQDTPFMLQAKGRHKQAQLLIDNMRLFAFDEEVLTIQGTYQKDIFDFTLQAKKLPAQLFSKIGLRSQPGKLTAKLHAQGSLQQPKLTGNLSYETVISGYNNEGEKEPINFNWDLKLNTHKNNLTLLSSFQRGTQAPGELNIKAPIQPYVNYLLQKNKSPTPLEFPTQATIAGKFNLQIFSLILDPDLHRLTGNMTVDLNLTETLTQPKITGTLNIAKSRYENPISGTLIDQLNCTFKALNANITLEQCQATDGYSGDYYVTGALQLPLAQSPGNVDLTVKANSANILRRADIDSEATGAINLAGDFSAMLATGNLEMAPLTAILDSNLSNGIPSIRIEEAISHHKDSVNKDAQPKFNSNIGLDITLSASQQAFLRGRGLEAELQGKISLQGNTKKPLYDGEFKVVRGVFEVFNKKFNLETGQVNFANNAIALTITGAYEKNGQRIQVDLSGTNSDLKISFSATPHMPEDEILAYIIFGKSIQSITPFEVVQLASAIQTLRGSSGSFDPIGSTRKMLGLDTLSVESSTSDTGETGINVGVGKYINERVYIELERTPNASQPWKGNIEIELTPNVNFESSTGGSTGIEGAELKWKKDY